jgi:tRNA A-37 threonylcarbamoyl transferase component Bud32
MTFPPESPTPTFPYRIEQRVGEGAMGVVYRAIEPALERRVAIKVLKPAAERGATADEEYRLRFLQEARAAAALSHPGATTIFRIGDEAGAPYIAMEWLEGETLEALLRREGPLPAERVIQLGGELLSALDAAHRAGVVHRDIKPANLVVLADGRLKVTDFGIARLRGSDLVKTQTGVVLATPRFASPEQLRGDDIDGRSDLFAAGILLFHLLTGDFPFRGSDFFQIANAIFRDPPVPLRSVDPGIPEGLAAVVERALAKDPAGRYPSAAAMRDALLAAPSPSTLPTQLLAAAAAPGTARGPSTLAGLPLPPGATATAVAQSWPTKELGPQSARALLDRLMDRPLHAPAFSGAVRFGGTLLFLADGTVLGAYAEASGESGDAVVEGLPERCTAILHPAPPDIGARGVAVLAALLLPLKERHAGLDSSFVNLPALAARLGEERFDGFLRLERSPQALGYVLFVDGRPLLAFYAGDWGGLPIAGPWQDLVAGLPLKASVLEARREPAFLSYRRELADVEIAVAPRGGAGGKRAPELRPVGAAEGAERAGEIAPPAVADDPLFRFLRWSLTEIRPFLRAHQREGKWKYLVDWLDDVRSARLHPALHRPGSAIRDPFDLATFDGDGRVLHLAWRAARATPAVLADFSSRVVEAKAARTKTGDVGGAFLIARQLDADTLEAYRTGGAALTGSGRWSLGVEETLTGYEGFVRTGPRRGFHLLLVEESAEGFLPILPFLS